MTLPWKYISISFLIGILFGGALGVGGSRHMMRKWKSQGHEWFLKKLDKHLTLTAEQRDQVKSILKSQRSDMQKTRADRRDKIRDEIRKILTAEQQPKFDAMIARMEERRKKRDGR